jgi:large subunit ribosomal protein L21
MYAVIKTGGKQHKVQAGDVIEIEKLVVDGETVEFHPLLVVDDDGKTHVGAEAAKAVVTAKPLGEKKGEKVKVFKYRPKSGYARKAGHRQLLTMLEITEVKLPTKRAASKTDKDETAAAEKKSTEKKSEDKKSDAKTSAAKDEADAAAASE